MAFENCTFRLKVAPFHEHCRTLKGLSKMVLANVIAVEVLKIFHNFVSMQITAKKCNVSHMT